MTKNYVLDTNVLIQAPYAFSCFEEHNIYLPVAVLEELDNLKNADGETGANARRIIYIWLYQRDLKMIRMITVY